MKNIYLALIILFIIASCQKKEGISQNIKELQEQRTLLKTQMDSLSKKLKSINDQLSKLDTIKKLPVVTTVLTKNADFNHYIEVQGSVKADKSVEIHPEMGGTVQKIYVKEGQRVRKGQTLAQLDASVVNNSIAQLQVQLNLAKTSFERQERLWEQKIGSEMQFLQAKAQKEGLEQNLNILYAQAKKMKIIAPFSGTIDEIFAKVGALSSAQMPFLRIVNLNKVYIESEITETYLKDIKKGTNVIVSFPSLGKEIASKINQVANFINPNNRSFKARVDLNNKDKTIKPNLLADVKINDFKATGIAIPSYLIQKDVKGNSYVFVLTKNDSSNYNAIKTILTIGKEYNNESFIDEGLKEGDLIIDKGARTVKNNDEVILAEK